MAHFPKAHHALGHEIDEPSRGGHEDFRAAGQGLSLGPNGAPPKTQKLRVLCPAVKRRISVWIWAASSRVGARMSARGQRGTSPARIGQLFNEGKGEGRRLSPCRFGRCPAHPGPLAVPGWLSLGWGWGS
jgi:hypothetical protein